MTNFRIVHIAPCRARVPLREQWVVGQPPRTIRIVGEYQDGVGGARIPVGLRTIAELRAETRAEAEADARALTMTWASLVCFVAGVEVARLPRHIATLESTAAHRAFAFTQFFYDLHGIPPSQPASLDLIQPIDERLRQISQDEELSKRLALAVRWYTVGLGEIDAVDRFLSLWIALEALGPPLGTIVHPAGPKPSCSVCRNPAGVDRDRGKAGMQHLLALVSGDTRLLSKLEQARNDIFHGLRHLDELEGVMTLALNYLPRAVARAILTVVAPAGSGSHYEANEPLPLSSYPHARLDCTLIDPSSEHLRLAQYEYLFRGEFRDPKATNHQDGGVSIVGGVAFSCPGDLDVANETFTLLPTPGVTLRGVGDFHMFLEPRS